MTETDETTTPPVVIDMQRIKIKTLRKLEAAQKRGMTLDDIVELVPEMVEGWTAAMVDELTLSDLNELMDAIKQATVGAVPNVSAPSSSPPSPRTERGRPAGRKR